MVQHLADAERGSLIQSVQRAASLLKVFGHEDRALGVSELSRMTHLHKSTVSRLLATLEHEGLSALLVRINISSVLNWCA